MSLVSVSVCSAVFVMEMMMRDRGFVQVPCRCAGCAVRRRAVHSSKPKMNHNTEIRGWLVWRLLVGGVRASEWLVAPWIY